MKTISLVYNLDTRPKFMADMTTTADCDGGCRCIDFFTHGLLNKIKFLAPYELEVIVYVDVHEPVPENVLEAFEKFKREGKLHKLVMKDHSPEAFGKQYGKNNNDLIYAESLSYATGDYVTHFDSDIAAYKRPEFSVANEYMNWLEMYDYVSIPSPYTPNCIDFQHEIWRHMRYMWASTRFFICKRKTLPDFDEMVRCFDNRYLANKYGAWAMPNCLEHILGVISGTENVFYPPMELDKYLIVSWSQYYKGTLERLNVWPYEKVKEYILTGCGGIHGCNDVVGQPIIGE